MNKKKLLFIPVYVNLILFLLFLSKTQPRFQVHNLAGFDSHLIVKALKIDKKRFSVLPRNAERIVTMSIGNWKFIDSSSFLPESLESLVKNLKEKDPDLFIQTKKLAGDSITKFNFLTEKGIFPYEYLNTEERLKERQLPEKEHFYSSLKESRISDEDYVRATNVWKEFGCKTLGDYMKLYCTSDTHLLADVWANFCNVTSQNFKVHPEAGYFTLPSYSFDAFKLNIFKENKTTMTVIDETLKDFQSDIHKNIRGGSCMGLQKIAIDSKLEEILLDQANDDELLRMEEIRNDMKQEATKKSNDLKKRMKAGKAGGVKIRRCAFDGCGELVTKVLGFCKLHLKRCIISFDFNNLYVG